MPATITIGVGNPSLNGSVLSDPLRWPVANPGAIRKYVLDISAVLADLDDDLASVAVSVSPSGTGELTPVSVQAAGGVITVVLTAGVRGRNYTVQIDAELSDGDTLEYEIGLLINPTLAAFPLPDPPNPGSGASVTWAVPVTPVPALIFNTPKNFSAWPFGCGVMRSGSPIPPPAVVVPSLDFQSGLNIGLWFTSLGQVIEMAPPSAVPVPSLDFTVAEISAHGRLAAKFSRIGIPVIMADQLTPVPIVNGATEQVNGVYNTIVVNGTTCIAPFLSFLNLGQPVGPTNPLNITDVLALVNTGSIAANTAQEVALLGSLNAKVATSANQVLEIAALGSIVAALGGTLTTSGAVTPPPTQVALAGTIVNPGTVAMIIAAGNAARGGFVQNPSSSSVFIDQVDNAPGTVAAGTTAIVYPGASYTINPTENPVYVNCSGTVAVTLAGFSQR